MLIVEDQMLIALELEQILETAGIDVIATFASPRETLFFLSATTLPDAAILDVNLGEATSEEVAVFLAENKVPFLFATGCFDSSAFPHPFDAIPIVRKPYSEEAILSKLDGLLSGHLPQGGPDPDTLPGQPLTDRH